MSFLKKFWDKFWWGTSTSKISIEKNVAEELATKIDKNTPKYERSRHIMICAVHESGAKITEFVGKWAPPNEGLTLSFVYHDRNFHIKYNHIIGKLESNAEENKRWADTDKELEKQIKSILYSLWD